VISLHNARWQERGTDEAFSRPALIAFHDEVTRMSAARGWLRLYLLRLDGTPAAAVYCLRRAGVMTYLSSGWKPGVAGYSPGLVILGLVIKSAMAEGATELDLGHGDDGYKHHWTREERPLRKLELYPPGALGWIARTVGGVERQVRSLGKRVVWGT
jgi:CelD/BcsL family acetyltransferase involved in cellulose biosynthesis